MSVAISTWLAHRQAPATPAPQALMSAPTLRNSSLNPYLITSRLQHESCDTSDASKGQVESEPSINARDEEVTPNREAEDYAEVERVASLVADHHTKPRDRNWASQAETTVLHDLRTIVEKSGGSFTFRDIDCRTDSCTALLTWPSPQDARADLLSVVQQVMGNANCGREMALDPGAEADVSATLYITCAEEERN